MLIDVQHHAVHVERRGEGPPALLLHGVPDTARLWTPVIDGIANRYCCHAPDFTGIGRSAVNPDFTFTLDGLADWVEAVVVALGITTPLTLAAHDWGGVMGLAWACKYPHRVSRVVLMSAPFHHLYRWHAWARIWRTPLLGELSMALINKPLFQREMRRGSRRLTQAQLDEVWRGAPARRASRRVILKLYRGGDVRQFIPWEGRLKTLVSRVPLQVLWGEHDVYLPRWLTTTFHTPHVEIVPGVGHWVPAEAPERVIAAL